MELSCRGQRASVQTERCAYQPQCQLDDSVTPPVLVFGSGLLAPRGRNDVVGRHLALFRRCPTVGVLHARVRDVAHNINVRECIVVNLQRRLHPDVARLGNRSRRQLSDELRGRLLARAVHLKEVST